MQDIGFVISGSTKTMILIVFTLYSVIVMALGFYVKYASRHETSQSKVASFLTGGGNLGPIAVGLIMVTNLMSSGGMVGGPGMSYGTGFIWSLCVYCSYINIFLSLSSVGKKMAIMGHRTGSQTVIQLFRHRYQSKAFSTVLSLVFIIFLLPYAGSQFIGGGKLFAVVTGTNNYNLGVLLFAGITLIYTLTGGIKSMAKIAVFQGGLMLFSVIALYIGTFGALGDQYGSLQNAMQFVQANNPKLVDASTWTPLIFMGTAITQSLALIPLPHGLVGTFTYKKTSTMLRAILIGVVSYTIIQTTMSGIGPLAYAVNPNLKVGDYVVPMLLSQVVPPWLGGVAIAGAVAAIQSTVAAFFIIIASSLVKDLYKSLINPNLSIESENKGNVIFTVVAAAISIVMALFPGDYLQVIVNFAIGGIASGFFFPMFCGLYWKKATPVAAVTSSIAGTAIFIIATMLKANPTFKAITFGAHPIILGFLLSGLLMAIVSRFTQKVNLGVCQVWFADRYNEKYASAK